MDGFERDNGGAPVRRIAGPVFDAATIKTMRGVLDDLCAKDPRLSRPLAREFTAWLIVRLAGTGLADAADLRRGAERALNGGSSD